MTGTFRGLAGVALLLMCLGGPARAQVKDPAELAPATTLAYFELRHPDKLAGELQTIIKNSVLNDMPKYMAQMREKMGDDGRRFGGMMMRFGPEMVLSPEAIAEFGRIQGGFVAITGMNREGPEVVGVILSGSSNVPTLALRTYLTIDDVRIRGEVEGVTVYAARHGFYRKDDRFLDKKDFRKDDGPRERPKPEVRYGPFFALLPDAIVIGSREDDVKDVVRRMKGKNAQPSLTSVRGFKESATLRDRPGVFAYADLTALMANVDEVMKNARGRDARDYQIFKKIVNPAAFKSAAASWSLHKGEVAFQAQLHIDPKQGSPVLDLLPSGKASLDPLQFCPPDGLLAFSVNFEDGEKRFKKFIEMMDDIVGAELGGDHKPSAHIAQIEKAIGLDAGKDVFAKVANLGVVLSWGKEMPSHPSKMFALVVTASDGEAVKYLEESVLPKLVAIANDGREVKPTKDRILDIPVTAYPMGRAGAIYCGRHGKTLVVGMDGQLVAQCLLNGSRGEGVLKDARIAAAVKGPDDAIFIGTVNMGRVVKGMMTWVMLEERSSPPFGGGKGRDKVIDRPIRDRDFPKDARPTDKPDFEPRPKDVKPVTDVKPPLDRPRPVDKPATTAPIRIKPVQIEDKPATTAPIRIKPIQIEDKPATTKPSDIREKPALDKPDFDGRRDREKPALDKPDFDGRRDRPREDVQDRPRDFKDAPPPRDRGDDPRRPREAKVDPEFAKFMKEFDKVLDDIPSAVVFVRRKPDLVTLEFRQVEFSKHASKLIDFGMMMGLQQVSGAEERFREEERRERERFEEFRKDKGPADPLTPPDRDPPPSPKDARRLDK